MLGVCKSAAWVNQLLRWRKDGYDGAPFRSKAVQGLNKIARSNEPGSTELTSTGLVCAVQSRAVSVTSKDYERVIDAGLTADFPEVHQTPLITVPSVAHGTGDYHLPPGLNRQDPERAYQRLVEQLAFQELFFNSPSVAQERYLREVLLHGMAGAELIIHANEVAANDGKTTAGIAS